MSLITENNRQYYEGAQGFTADGNTFNFKTTFNTKLVTTIGTSEAERNYKVYTELPSEPGVWRENDGFTVQDGATVIFDDAPINGERVVVQLKTTNGGNYGVDESEKAYGNATQENWGSYAYIKLDDIINNFMVGYVGVGKLIPSVKRTDVIFHAKRGLQEFSYDTLKSIKSQELTVQPSLSVPIPQDYVNYVKMSWIDDSGIKHTIYPTTLTSNPTQIPLQDSYGVPTQDSDNNNVEGTSVTEERWSTNNIGEIRSDFEDAFRTRADAYGGRYGIQPEVSQINGWFTINKRENTFSFSNDLVDRVIILEYISDGLAYDLETKVPKMAEEAMYAHIIYSILAGRANQPEYVVRRLKQDRSSKLRNAKIRLSNIKLSEITQVMRGKSKQIKH